MQSEDWMELELLVLESESRWATGKLETEKEEVGVVEVVGDVIEVIVGTEEGEEAEKGADPEVEVAADVKGEEVHHTEACPEEEDDPSLDQDLEIIPILLWGTRILYQQDHECCY